MAKQNIKVEGKKEAISAFNKVNEKTDDLTKAHQAEAEMLLPDVRAATRVKSGDLVAGWATDGIATEARFLNEMPYANIQEFGSSTVEPTNAVSQAFEANEERTKEVYADAVRDIAESAGFNTK